MRRLLLVAILLLSSPLALKAQGGNTTVIATIKDPSNNLYSNSQVNISFYDPGTSHKLPLLNGSTFQVTYTGYSTNSSGVMPPISLADNGAIASGSGATGTQWSFNICFSDRVTCFSTKITINCASNLPATCTANTIDISAALQAASAPVSVVTQPASLTGNNAFSGNNTFTGALIAPAIGPSLTQQHTLPAVTSDVFGLLAAAQTFTNKTFTSPTINGGALNGTFTGNPTISPANINKVIYAAGFGVVCDGVTVNSTTVINAIAAGGQNAHVIFPPGVCLVSIEAGTFNVYDGSWYSGDGKFATVIRRANGGSANNSIFTIALGGAFGTLGNAFFSDFTCDGNYLNETGGGDCITGTTPISKLTIMRMRFINNWNDGIALRLGSGNSADTLIADNDFESNGLRAGCVGLNLCQDILVSATLRARITRNRADSSQNFATFSGHNNAGTVTISENTVNACLGFAVALGGGGTNPGPAGISDNTFNCPTSTQNVIDLALWSDPRVENNTITIGTAFYGIADGPPANKAQVIGNHLTGNATNAGCIAIGANDSIIQGNYCNGSGGAGIQLTPTVAGQKNITIEGNTVKNTSQANSGLRGGIDVSINAGTTITAVVMEGNRLFDDLGAAGTQGFGIGLATSGQATGFTNFTIEGNDVRGNKTSGISSAATPTTGFVIANNPGGESAILCQLTVCPTQTIGSGTVTTNGTGIAAGTSQIQPGITVTGTLATDVATCSLPSNPPATWQTGIQMLPPVPSANTVTIFLSNPTAALITPAAAVVRCTVTR